MTAKQFRRLVYCGAMLLTFCAEQGPGWAQSGGQGDTNQSWNSTSDQHSPSGDSNPIRTVESHKEENGRTVDKQSLERLGPDGRYEPYRDTERESVRVDANTIRTVERTFGRGPDGQKALVQVREEETRRLPDGEQKVVRTVSNPDANGRLQMVQREPGETKQTVESYSTEVPGGSGDGKLQLNQRVTRVGRKSADGSQQSEEQVEQRNPAAPGEAPRMTQKTIDIVRPNGSGEAKETRTIQSLDGNG